MTQKVGNRILWGVILTALIFAGTVIYGAGEQNAKIKENTEDIAEHKDDVKGMSITIHRKLNEHIREQKVDTKEMKQMLNSIYYKVK